MLEAGRYSLIATAAACLRIGFEDVCILDMIRVILKFL